MPEPKTPRKIRVLVVDDSATFRAALSIALETDPEIQVVGQAADGKAAIALVDQLTPDVVTMDVVMPVLDGLEASKHILAHRPIPILLMSTLARSEEQRMALNALRLGVVDVTNKPVLAGPSGNQGIAQVIRLVKAANDVEVVVRPRSGRYRVATAQVQRKLELITIAASTGGPPALERILGLLPAQFPPVVIAQHLAPSFARGFADWLSSAVARPVLPVSVAEPLKAGHVYIAAEGHHIRVRKGFAEGVKAEPNELSPNANVLFHSVAAGYGAHALGVVLTGMGDDGAKGLKAMRTAGAWTVGQDRDSSVVYGMPRVAFEAGACCEVISLDEIASRIIGLLADDQVKRA
jgi:two-component system, chemotaxis family, protein-glutamate methylesterase/glutaminase